MKKTVVVVRLAVVKNKGKTFGQKQSQSYLCRPLKYSAHQEHHRKTARSSKG